MPEVILGQGFELGFFSKAIVAFFLLIVWREFQKILSFYLLLFFDGWCYYEGDCRNRTLKTKYVNGFRTQLLQLT